MRLVKLANRPLADRLSGFPEHPRSNPALAAVLLENLYAIDAECEAMYYASLHYSITKHVHAIRQSVAEIIEEIAGRPVA